MKLIKALEESILKHSSKNAFFLNDVYYNYNEFAKSISGIRESIQNSINKSEKIVGLVAANDLETYATIIALWLEGKAYLPISPSEPSDRNIGILNQMGTKTIIGSGPIPFEYNCNFIYSKNLRSSDINLIPVEYSDEEISVVLFTSGSTGVPKGVPLTFTNIRAFSDVFLSMGISFDENDKFLQFHELTFDVSVMLYVIPLLIGACVYLIPDEGMKFANVIDSLEEHGITCTFILPSLLFCFRSYFNELSFEGMRLCIIGGEAVPVDLMEEWSKCVPNSDIIIVYGPTEDTVFCTTNLFKRNSPNKAHNGILSLGLPIEGSDIIVIDDNRNILKNGEKGELCVAGDQLTPGYWNNDLKNKESFFIIDYNGKKTRFYRTGDLCFIDEDGYSMFLGRMDFQTKIQGYRIELSEVEFHARAILGKIYIVALAFNNKIGVPELGLAIESEKFETNNFLEKLKIKLPPYMIPTRIEFIDKFPLNKNGKVDRKILLQNFN